MRHQLASLASLFDYLCDQNAVTHWRYYCDQFADRFQDVQFERDRIWVQDGSLWSSAGISAGVDLTLALIEKDQGVSVALQVAREQVVFLKRPGGQSQFSTLLSGQISDAAGPSSSLFAWIADHLDAGSSCGGSGGEGRNESADVRADLRCAYGTDAR